MKRLFPLSAIAFVLIFPLNLTATPPEGSISPASKPAWQFGFGVPLFRHTYEEPSLMKESGWVPGLGLVGFARHTAGRLMLNFEAEVALSKVKYEGQARNLQDSVVSIEISGISDAFYEVRLTGGPALAFSNGNSLTPYFGVGVRWWSDGLDVGPGGYYRQSRYFYSPIGVQFRIENSCGSQIGLVLEYDKFWKGRQKSRLSDTNYESPDGSQYVRLTDATNYQSSGNGLRASATFYSKPGVLGRPGMRWGIRGFFRYWDIDESDVSTSRMDINIGDPELDGEWWIYGIEPANNTLQFGLVLMLLSR